MPLPVIRVNVISPCPIPRDAMPPSNASGRWFCDHCQRHVHDLSRLRSGEVEELICKSAGSLCVRYEPLPDGSVKTLDYAERTGKEGRTRRWLLIGAIVSLLAGVANAVWHKKNPAPPPMMAGGIGAATVVPSVAQQPPPQCP